MNADASLPYGSKSLLECMTRATVLAQPDDIPRFLSMHLEGMIHSTDEQSRDPKEVAFRHEEQWENSFFQEERKRTKSLKPSAKDFPSTTPRVSGTSSASATSSAPTEVRRKTGSKTLARTASQEESVHPTAKEKRFSFIKPRTISLPSPWPVIPPISRKSPQQVPKQVRGQKTTKKCGIACRLADCPHHIKQKENSPADKGPVRTSAGSTLKNELGLQKSNTEPRPLQEVVPYRPKGGYIVDPELEPRRRGSMSESSYPRKVHIIRYKGMQVHCSEVRPHCGRMRNITLQPNTWRWPVAMSTITRNPVTRNSSAVSKLPNSYLSIRNSPQPPNNYRP